VFVLEADEEQLQKRRTGRAWVSEALEHRRQSKLREVRVRGPSAPSLLPFTGPPVVYERGPHLLELVVEYDAPRPFSQRWLGHPRLARDRLALPMLLSDGDNRRPAAARATAIACGSLEAYSLSLKDGTHSVSAFFTSTNSWKLPVNWFWTKTSSGRSPVSMSRGFCPWSMS
jgi:hypothetical protein